MNQTTQVVDIAGQENGRAIADVARVTAVTVVNAHLGSPISVDLIDGATGEARAIGSPGEQHMAARLIRNQHVTYQQILAAAVGHLDLGTAVGRQGTGAR